MDLIKIGKYIAGKRKELGMTQKQLAGKLGMSDKSVSKWERGVCLPDVAVYSDLCLTLGISINEFLAGEDISEEDIEQKSEENIMVVTTDCKQKQNKLRLVISVLLFVILIVLSIIGITVCGANRPQNYIAPVSESSAEMQTIQLLSGPVGAHLYRFVTTDEYKSVRIYLREYRDGELMTRDDHCWEMEFDDIVSPAEGEILIIPDFNDFLIKVIISTDRGKLSAEIPILPDVENREYYGRTAIRIEGETRILYGMEQPLAGLIFDNGEMRVPDIYDFLSGGTESFPGNDYVYLFTYEFSKE